MEKRPVRIGRFSPAPNSGTGAGVLFAQLPKL
jgi:hypothetical protein